MFNNIFIIVCFQKQKKGTKTSQLGTRYKSTLIEHKTRMSFVQLMCFELFQNVAVQKILIGFLYKFPEVL